ncbi:Peroxiredoxin [Hexamita inflata]|uniref:Peroxiredoxin n=1 Tax=Hexamita inflata TaxID=28002 RepID=A0AA86PNX4_9EUKA|nr:Peroxiredoxin [Hexamita inflata]
MKLINTVVPDLPLTILRDNQFVQANFSDYNRLVLVFYPQNFETTTTTTLMKYSKQINRFTAQNIQVLAGSIESAFNIYAFNEQAKAKLDLFADKNAAISDYFGVNDKGKCIHGVVIIINQVIKFVGVGAELEPRVVLDLFEQLQ